MRADDLRNFPKFQHCVIFSICSWWNFYFVLFSANAYCWCALGQNKLKVRFDFVKVGKIRGWKIRQLFRNIQYGLLPLLNFIRRSAYQWKAESLVRPSVLWTSPPDAMRRNSGIPKKRYLAKMVLSPTFTSRKKWSAVRHTIHFTYVKSEYM